MAEPTENPPRGPTNLRIKFRSASLDQFIERYAVDVSRGGIFIRTREPLSVGTRLKLEFQLQDAAPLLAGEGTVVWIREPDPMRENVTPGMGVRFDKLTPESQPTLEKILAEKTRLQQSGGPPTGLTKTGGGMAVRRTSGVFPAVDPAAPAGLPKAPTAAAPSTSAAARGPASAAPTPGPAPAPTPAAPPSFASRVTSAAPPAGAEPAATSAAPRPASPFASVSKTTFMASRPVTPTTPTGAGGPLRARTTTGSGVRPAPVPSALFEPPTADDIDKALEALHETSGVHLPPATPPAPVETVAEGTTESPRLIADDPSNEPTRVVDVVDELVGGSAGRPPGLPNTASDRPAVADVAPPAQPSETHRSAAALETPIESELPEVEPAKPLPPEPRVRKTGPIPKQGGVAQPIAPEKSTRFRAASSAYPTLQRRKRNLGLFIVAIGGLAIAAVLKLPWKERLFPRGSAPAPAPVVEAPAAAVPAPAPAVAPSAVAPVAPAAMEGPDAAVAAKAEPAAAPAPATPPPPAEAVPDQKPATALAGKPASGNAPDDQPAVAGEPPHPAKHAGIHRRPHEATDVAAEANAAAGTPGGEPSPSGAKAGGEKAGGAKPADKAGDDKATDKNAAAPAPSPTEAAPPAPPPPVLKITSTPAGAEVIVDGTSVGYTPFTSKALDPTAPHAITVKKDGFEPTERMIGGLDWSRPHGNSPASLKVNVKLHRIAPTPASAPNQKESGEPAEDTGGPYIKEIKPDSP